MPPAGIWSRFRMFLAPPVFPGDEEKTRVAELLNALLFSILLAVILFGIPSVILVPRMERILIQLGLLFLLLVPLFLLRSGRVRLASVLFLLGLFIAVSLGAYLAGGFRGFSMSAYIVIILIAGLLLGRRIALAFGAGAIAFTGWLAYADSVRLLPTATEPLSSTRLWGEFSMALVAIVGLFALVINNLRAAYERTKRKERELAFRLVESEQLAVWAQEASDFKTHLLARVSHELRTPLTVIVGMTEMLRLEAYGALTNEQKRVLERIQVNSKFLETTFSELLEQSHLDRDMLPMQAVSFSPAELLKKVISEFRQDAEEKGLILEEQIMPGLPDTMWGIPSRLEQILYHLISNAIKFTRTGSICTTLLRRDADHWAMRVSDTGIGIPKEYEDSIFEPFRQVDETIAREYGGMGLGLSIVKRLTSSLKGRIRVESEPGVGSTFTVTLPILEPDDENGLLRV